MWNEGFIAKSVIKKNFITATDGELKKSNYPEILDSSKRKNELLRIV